MYGDIHQHKAGRDILVLLRKPQEVEPNKKQSCKDDASPHKAANSSNSHSAGRTLHIHYANPLFVQQTTFHDTQQEGTTNTLHYTCKTYAQHSTAYGIPANDLSIQIGLH